MTDKTTILTGGTNSFQTTAEHVNYPATDLLANGIVGAVTNTAGVAPATGGLACNAQGSPNMTVAVTAGIAYVLATPTGQASQRLRAAIAAQNATIAANATGGTRFDWIYVTINATNANTPNAAGDNVASITVSRSTSSSVDNGTPPTYGYNIAIVTVANGAASITNGNIADSRVRVAHQGSLPQANVAGSAWVSWTPSWTGLSVGNGVVTAMYTQVGRVTYFRLHLVGGTTTTHTAAVEFTLPVAAHANYSTVGAVAFPIGPCEAENSGVQNFPGIVAIASTSGVGHPFITRADSTYAGWVDLDTSPFTFGNADSLQCSGTYESAA